MAKLPGQGEEQRTVPITYRAAIFARRDGEDVPLNAQARGSSIRGLAEDLLAKASELESEAKEQLDRVETERGKSQRAERSGRRRRSWE